MVLIQMVLVQDLELKLKLVFRSLRMTLSFAVIVIMIIIIMMIMMITTTSKIDWILDDNRMEKISRFLEQHEPHILNSIEDHSIILCLKKEALDYEWKKFYVIN